MGGRGSALGPTLDMSSLELNLEMYVGGGYGSIRDAVTDAEFNYILNNMQSTNSSLYRVEDDMFTASNLEVGDTFSFNDNLRSFTRDSNYASRTVSQALDEGFMNSPVVFKTVGTVKHFNADRYAQAYYENQSESFAGGSFRVRRIYRQSGTKYIEIEQVRSR